MKLLLGVLLSVAAGLLLSLESAEAKRNQVVPIYRLQSDEYPIEVVSRDRGMNQWLIDLSNETVEELFEKIDIEEIPFSELEIRWRPGDLESTTSFPRELNIVQGRPVLKINLTGADRIQVVAIKRTLIISLLQAYIWNGVDEIGLEFLPEPPLWLTEGLLWDSEPFMYERWRAIVSKAVRIENVPPLAEMQTWEELSELRLEKIWQQAFFYRLVQEALRSQVERRAVLLWLKKHQNSDAIPFWDDSAEVESWWQEAISMPMKKKIPIKDWEESVVMLNQLNHFSLRLKNGERKMFFLDRLPAGLELDLKDQSIIDYFNKLDELALSSHYLLNPVVTRYRNAVKKWYSQDYEGYLELLEQAEKWKLLVFEKKRQATDMLDWSVVNLDVGNYQQGNELLTDYAASVRELENERFRVRRELQQKIFKP